jgi:hypothetical protein
MRRSALILDMPIGESPEDIVRLVLERANGRMIWAWIIPIFLRLLRKLREG